MTPGTLLLGGDDHGLPADVTTAARDELRARRQLAVVTYAATNADDAAQAAVERFADTPAAPCPLPDSADASRILAGSDAIYVADGDVFRLLRTLRGHGLVELIRELIVRRGAPYLGVGAGAQAAGASLHTTHQLSHQHHGGDTQALNLLPFELHTGFIDEPVRDVAPGWREAQAILATLEHHPSRVLALRPGSWLQRDPTGLVLVGRYGAVLFERDRSRNLAPGPIGHLFTR